MDPYRLIPKYQTNDLEELLGVLLKEQEELEAYERQRYRADLLKENIHQQRYAPWRVSKAVNELVEKRGINRNPAFRQVAERIREKGENWNVVQGGANAPKAYGPWFTNFKDPKNAKPVNQGNTVVQKVNKPANSVASWHSETANEKRKRIANAATKRASNTATWATKKGGKRKTKRSKRSV